MVKANPENVQHFVYNRRA